jgi:putative transcriptional regulator
MKNNIRVERAIKRLTQEDLSRLVQVSRQTINAIESEKYVPSTLLSLKISKIFEKNVNDIFQLEESDWKES